MNTGAGNWAAKVLLPMPSGPYRTVLTGAAMVPDVIAYLLISERSFRPCFGGGWFLGVFYPAILNDDLALPAGRNAGGDGL